MMRYRHLLVKAVENGATLREMARAMKLPPSSLHNYLHMDTEPRVDALQKMSAYFGEPISLLLSEDDDLTAQLVNLIRKLHPRAKRELLKSLSKNHGP
jgi:transcriptional regulator with XRE-family HTH domain